MPPLGKRSKLDEIILDVELLLISVVQGLAVTTLAEKSIDPLQNLQFMYWPYILTAFIFILVYWAQAISHTLTFIRWPLDIGHSFLYYLTAIIEFLAFAHIANPLQWFLYTTVFMIVILFLYIFDLWILKGMKERFYATPAGRTLYDHTLKEQLFELKTFVPGGIIFNAVATYLIWMMPTLFINNNWHLGLIFLQGLFTLFILWRSIGEFK